MDISYSMQSNRDKMLDGLNKFVKTLKQRPDNTHILFSVMLFCERTVYLCRGVPVAGVTPFRAEDLPRYGLTHLYDALGKLLQEWIPEQRAQHHLFVITDGVDNGSKQLTKEQAKQACSAAVQECGWRITHCDVDISKLDCPGIKQVVYDADNLDQLLGNLRI